LRTIFQRECIADGGYMVTIYPPKKMIYGQRDANVAYLLTKIQACPVLFGADSYFLQMSSAEAEPHH
jgi:hypothetical protein